MFPISCTKIRGMYFHPECLLHFHVYEFYNSVGLPKFENQKENDWATYIKCFSIVYSKNPRVNISWLFGAKISIASQWMMNLEVVLAWKVNENSQWINFKLKGTNKVRYLPSCSFKQFIAFKKDETFQRMK